MPDIYTRRDARICVSPLIITEKLVVQVSAAAACCACARVCVHAAAVGDDGNDDYAVTLTAF